MSYGITYMLNALFENNDDKEPSEITNAKGKIISSIKLEPGIESDGAMVITFIDNSKISIYDDGRSCCENRYMTTDDNLDSFIGAEFIGTELADAPNIEDEYGEHEVIFLRIKTSLGDVTVETHNEHNGYYGGFVMRVNELV